MVFMVFDYEVVYAFVFLWIYVLTAVFACCEYLFPIIILLG